MQAFLILLAGRILERGAFFAWDCREGTVGAEFPHEIMFLSATGLHGVMYMVMIEIMDDCSIR